MPWIIDYELVLDQLRGAQQLRCHYYNSGAFGFPQSAHVRTLAWIGPDDPTIKPAARALTRSVPPPHEENLAALATQLWQHHLAGRAWVMPMSHWAYELSHGSRDWMPALIENLDLDPGLLEGRNPAAAIEFGADERERFEHLVARLLMMLSGSDFMIAFPGRPVLCTLHHHKQLWWSSTDEDFIQAADQLARQKGEGPA